MIIFRPGSRAKHTPPREITGFEQSSHSQTLDSLLLGQPVICRSHW